MWEFNDVRNGSRQSVKSKTWGGCLRETDFWTKQHTASVGMSGIEDLVLSRPSLGEGLLKLNAKRDKAQGGEEKH